MNKKLLIFSTGFALFSMFFGSGNLVFPITVGQQSGGHFLLAALGILLTGVVVPLLGVLGMMLYNGSIKNFFSSFGSIGTFAFSFASLALMGPFGVLARCFTVAHGAIESLVPNLPLYVTSLVFCLFIYLMTVKKNTIIPTLGTILTPLLLLAIAAIAFFAFNDPLPIITVKTIGGWSAFKNGFFQGYQTMDLLAAFFFSVFVINHLQSAKKQETTEKGYLKVFLQSSALGGGVLATVYGILVILGSKYAPSLASLPPQEMLGHIAMRTLGTMATPSLCLLVVLACFTTAIVLASLFSDFLQKEVCKGKINHHVSILITLTIGFFVSTLGFSGISKFIGPVLEVIYPALIMLTFVNIAHKFWGVKSSHWPVTLTFVARLLAI
ncbi:MAG: branched-chain amino acid transport system II carrier protein [Verrucomicrobia bacterium]|nr:branched-chain amino acid transport system II carrier protein [Verrucomicrobiota bacterium]